MKGGEHKMGRMITDKEIQKIEEKVRKEVDELFASWLKDVEYIEVFWKTGETDKFLIDELVRFWRTDLTFEIETKTRDVSVNVSETIKIIVSKKTKKVKK